MYQTKKLFNKAAHKVTSCFLKNHKKIMFKLKEVKKQEESGRKARADRNLNLNLRSFSAVK